MQSDFGEGRTPQSINEPLMFMLIQLISCRPIMSHCFARLGFENLHYYKNVFMSFSVAFWLKKRYRQKRIEILILLKWQKVFCTLWGVSIHLVHDYLSGDRRRALIVPRQSSTTLNNCLNCSQLCTIVQIVPIVSAIISPPRPLSPVSTWIELTASHVASQSWLGTK